MSERNFDRSLRHALTFVLGMLAGLLLLGLARCEARGEHAPGALHDWYESQHNGKGLWCCNEADGHQYDGSYTLHEDGTVTLGELLGAPREVEAFKVLKGPNPTGHAVVWFLQDADGTPRIYCFAPGPLT